LEPVRHYGSVVLTVLPNIAIQDRRTHSPILLKQLTHRILTSPGSVIILAFYAKYRAEIIARSPSTVGFQHK